MNTKHIRNKRIAYFTVGASGTVQRGIAVYKAAVRMGLNPHDFTFIVASPFAWLLEKLAPSARLVCLQSCEGVEPNEFLRIALQKLKEDERTNGTPMPDVLVCNGNIPQKTVQLYPNIEAWLMLREFNDLGMWLKSNGFNPYAWRGGVIGIEPGCLDDVEPMLDCPYYKIGPVISTWQDELLPENKARRLLLDLARKPLMSNRKIALAVHNGANLGEVNSIINRAKAITDSTGHILVSFSQDTGSKQIFQVKSVAQYFEAVDYLVAAPGSIFWEWAMLAPLDRVKNAEWVPVERYHDPQLKRLRHTQTLDMVERLRKQPLTGAEMTVRLVCGIANNPDHFNPIVNKVTQTELNREATAQ